MKDFLSFFFSRRATFFSFQANVETRRGSLSTNVIRIGTCVAKATDFCSKIERMVGVLVDCFLSDSNVNSNLIPVRKKKNKEGNNTQYSKSICGTYSINRFPVV